MTTATETTLRLPLRLTLTAPRAAIPPPTASTPAPLLLRQSPRGSLAAAPRAWATTPASRATVLAQPMTLRLRRRTPATKSFWQRSARGQATRQGASSTACSATKNAPRHQAISSSMPWTIYRCAWANRRARALARSPRVQTRSTWNCSGARRIAWQARAA